MWIAFDLFPSFEKGVHGPSIHFDMKRSFKDDATQRTHAERKPLRSLMRECAKTRKVL